MERSELFTVVSTRRCMLFALPTDLQHMIGRSLVIRALRTINVISIRCWTSLTEEGETTIECKIFSRYNKGTVEWTIYKVKDIEVLFGISDQISHGVLQALYGDDQFFFGGIEAIRIFFRSRYRAMYTRDITIGLIDQSTPFSRLRKELFGLLNLSVLTQFTLAAHSSEVEHFTASIRKLLEISVNIDDREELWKRTSFGLVMPRVYHPRTQLCGGQAPN